MLCELYLNIFCCQNKKPYIVWPCIESWNTSRMVNQPAIKIIAFYLLKRKVHLSCSPWLLWFPFPFFLFLLWIFVIPTVGVASLWLFHTDDRQTAWTMPVSSGHAHVYTKVQPCVNFPVAVSSWAFYFGGLLLRCNSHTVQFTHLKCVIQCFIT